MKVLYEFWKVIKLVGKFQANNKVNQKLKKYIKPYSRGLNLKKNKNFMRQEAFIILEKF